MTTRLRSRGTYPVRATITMTAQDKGRLEQLREQLKGKDGRLPSGSLAISEAIKRCLAGGLRG